MRMRRKNLLTSKWKTKFYLGNWILFWIEFGNPLIFIFIARLAALWMKMNLIIKITATHELSINITLEWICGFFRNEQTAAIRKVQYIRNYSNSQNPWPDEVPNRSILQFEQIYAEIHSHTHTLCHSIRLSTLRPPEVSQAILAISLINFHI